MSADLGADPARPVPWESRSPLLIEIAVGHPIPTPCALGNAGQRCLPMPPLPNSHEEGRAVGSGGPFGWPGRTRLPLFAAGGVVVLSGAYYKTGQAGFSRTRSTNRHLPNSPVTGRPSASIGPISTSPYPAHVRGRFLLLMCDRLLAWAPLTRASFGSTGWGGGGGVRVASCW